MSENFEARLLLNTARANYDYPLLTFNLHAVQVYADGDIRNFSTGLAYGFQSLADLAITAQYDNATASDGPYGWSVAYRDVFSIELRQAQEMVKTLRMVERGLAKLENELGYPESFAAYVARVAKILRITGYGWKERGNDSSYAANEYHWTDAKGLAYRIAHEVETFRKETAKVAS